MRSRVTSTDDLSIENESNSPKKTSKPWRTVVEELQNNSKLWLLKVKQQQSAMFDACFLQDTMHRWTSSTWYLPGPSRCIACKPTTSRTISTGTPSSSRSTSPLKQVQADGGGGGAKPGGGQAGPTRPQVVWCRGTFDTAKNPTDFRVLTIVHTANHNQKMLLLWRQSCLVRPDLVWRRVELINSEPPQPAPSSYPEHPLPATPPPRDPWPLCSLTVMWFERRVQLVILLVSTWASAASKMKFSLSKFLSPLFIFFCLIFLSLYFIFFKKTQAVCLCE